MEAFRQYSTVFHRIKLLLPCFFPPPVTNEGLGFSDPTNVILVVTGILGGG